MATSDTESAALGAVTPGEMLYSAREEQGISRREMADRLNWQPDYVIAVEENRFEVLRGAAFVSGYLRAYAKLLGIAEEDVLAALHAMGGPETADDGPRRVETRLPQVQKHGFGVPVGVAAAVIVIAGMWWLGSGEEEQQSGAVAIEQLPPVELEAPVVAAAVATVDTADPVSAGPDPAIDTAVVETEAAVPDPVPEQATLQDLPVAVEALVEQESSVVIDAPAAFSTEQPAADPAAGPEETMTFSFNADCWLEVRDAAGELIYADLRRAGNTLNVRGIAPFKVLVGDASAVDLRFRNELVTIPVRPGRTTARFTVGAL